MGDSDGRENGDYVAVGEAFHTYAYTCSRGTVPPPASPSGCVTRTTSSGGCEYSSVSLMSLFEPVVWGT